MQVSVPALCTTALLVLAMPPALAQAPDASETTPFELTVGRYQSSGGGLPSGHASDYNLRHRSSLGNISVGRHVASSEAFSQNRIGWDRGFEQGPLRIQPAVQLATGGAWIGSLDLETGETWYVGAGLGRSNLRRAVSLNYDPNDAWSLSGGYSWGEDASLGLLLVRDNRDNPDQQHLHLIWRTPLPGRQHLTVDLLHKRGLVEGEPIERTGLSVAYDWPRWFLRLAYDPKVDFTPQTMWRLALGSRF